MEQTTEIEVKEDATLSTEVYDFESDDGQGYSPDTTGDIQIPRLTILQPLSRAVSDEVPGAVPGKLYNTVTKEVFDKRRFAIAKIEKCYNEWIPLEDDGGFVGRHEVGSQVVRDARKATPRGAIRLGNGNDLKETIYLYTVPLDEDDQPLGTFEVIDFTSSKLSAWRAFNTLLMTCTIPTKQGNKRHPPLFAHIVEETTLKVKGTKGTYYVPALVATNKAELSTLLTSGRPPSAAYLAAKDLEASVSAGLMKVDNNSGGDEESTPNTESSEAPF